jgi:enoyl-CoA hydratase/carnithine racemase
VNAVDLPLARELGAAVAEAAAAASCRALVVAGDGRAFCGGIDVKALPAYDAATRADFLRVISRTLLALYALPKPTLAAVHGHALGAGLVLALACDLRVAAEGDYQLGLTEIVAGVPFPAGPLVVTKAELSHGLARKLMLTGDVFGPSDAAAREIFDAIVPPHRLAEETQERALRAARRGPTRLRRGQGAGEARGDRSAAPRRGEPRSAARRLAVRERGLAC